MCSLGNLMKHEASIPVWGGIECTVHRLGDHFYDQLMRNGHQQRDADIELIASLGIKTLRYPLLWERIAPKGLDAPDWAWTDNRLGKLKSLNITPVASLLHHGGGPSYTSLIDPEFPEKFTEFAKAVVLRYPWLEFFTPINEPLTTARFSCLYGLWYPHTCDDVNFSIAVLNQCKATIMAMREIKKIIPNAKLVQTEDLGKCHATKKMQYQADFENARRWLSLDLLTGNLHNNAVMVEFLRNKGKVKESDFDFFLTNNYPPDIIGINHYITSERFLDENHSKYPLWSYARNGVEAYSDVDIVRADIHLREGHYHILKSAVDRYQLPIALTEVHLGSTREAQLRWFMEAYDAAAALKIEGADVRAVTIWSIFGAFDWNSLLTQNNNFYESGVFDIRSGMPRPTALVRLVQSICVGQVPPDPVLKSAGWWKNSEQVHFVFGTQRDARSLPTIAMMFPENLMSSSARPVFITGATGTLGKAFAHICTMRNIPYVLLSRRDMDITDSHHIETLIECHRPWAIINAAGFVDVDMAESRFDICFRENVLGPIALARACSKYDIQFLTFSSDMVFDGKSAIPYVESSSAAPLNVYGDSKRSAETNVLGENKNALIIRTAAFFGPWDRHNFIIKMISSIKNGQVFLAASDQIVSPTYVPDLVNACLDLIIDEALGVWHLANQSALSWADFAIKAAEEGGLDTRLIKPVPTNELSQVATRPAYSVLGTNKGMLLPNLDCAIERYFSEGAFSCLVTSV